MKKILDLLDEITMLTAILNRQIAVKDFKSAYAISRTLSIKLSTLMENLLMEELQSGEVR